MTRIRNNTPLKCWPAAILKVVLAIYQRRTVLLTRNL